LAPLWPTSRHPSGAITPLGRMTIAFAGLLDREFGGFMPPPDL
jgi:hypothetical protein